MVEKNLSITEICSNADVYVGQIVTLHGLFHRSGSRALLNYFPKNAAPYAQKTDCDWVLQIGDKCLYVTGGLKAIPTPNNGESLELQAEIAKDSEGKVYLVGKTCRNLGYIV